MTDTGSMFSDSRPLQERLESHLQNCSECQKAIQAARPVGLGAHSKLCSEYQDIIAVWAEQEGAANNIVAHDEYGNQADPQYYLKGGQV